MSYSPRSFHSFFFSCAPSRAAVRRTSTAAIALLFAKLETSTCAGTIDNQGVWYFAEYSESQFPAASAFTPSLASIRHQAYRKQIPRQFLGRTESGNCFRPPRDGNLERNGRISNHSAQPGFR